MRLSGSRHCSSLDCGFERHGRYAIEPGQQRSDILRFREVPYHLGFDHGCIDLRHALLQITAATGQAYQDRPTTGNRRRMTNPPSAKRSISRDT